MTRAHVDDLRRRIDALESEVRTLRADARDRTLNRLVNGVVVQVALFVLSLVGMVAAGVVWMR